MIHSDEEYLVVTRIMSIFALYNVNKHSMPRQKREKSGTGICHVMQGKESKTCPYDSGPYKGLMLYQSSAVYGRTIFLSPIENKNYNGKY